MTHTRVDLITTSITAESATGRTTGRQHPTDAEIARLAYQLYEARGRADGRDIEDWVRAERALTHEYAAALDQQEEIVALATLRNGSALTS